MDIQLWLVANSFGIIMGVIGGIIWVNQQNADRKGENQLTKQDLNNHKLNHRALEERMEKHENKIDEKLNSLSEKMDSLKDLIIERTK